MKRSDIVIKVLSEKELLSNRRTVDVLISAEETKEVSAFTGKLYTTTEAGTQNNMFSYRSSAFVLLPAKATAKENFEGLIYSSMHHAMSGFLKAICVQAQLHYDTDQTEADIVKGIVRGFDVIYMDKGRKYTSFTIQVFIVVAEKFVEPLRSAIDIWTNTPEPVEEVNN